GAGPLPLIPGDSRFPGHGLLSSWMEASGLELALAGERACKAGDFTAGVAFFEAAVQVGTDDLKTLSAIYSQLGNAYFYLKEYAKALEFHRHDLTLARTIGDRIGEAKASGNLGNTLKILGQFDEAVVCCQRHLDISQEQGDKVGEARALYNIGNVYHAKGKQLSWSWPQEPGQLPQEVQEALERASEFYERNLSLVKELGDRAAQGRAYGNLGNSQYLLGNFGRAVIFHKQRLAIAKEFGDKSAERRAYSNLGNAHIFLGRFDISAEYYKKTLQLSRQLKDHVMEAQSCYSLGNTYTLLQDYEKAIEYHLKHLAIAQELGDRAEGSGRSAGGVPLQQQWADTKGAEGPVSHCRCGPGAQRALRARRWERGQLPMDLMRSRLPRAEQEPLRPPASGHASAPQQEGWGGDLVPGRGSGPGSRQRAAPCLRWACPTAWAEAPPRPGRASVSCGPVYQGRPQQCCSRHRGRAAPSSLPAPPGGARGHGPFACRPRCSWPKCGAA
uniref:G protein signaling modulator 1 n=1 Tax=Varanus komodoensis TaxID=61221 RepID=A0A8D2LSQ2_VARKO